MRHIRDFISVKTPVGTTRHTKQSFKDQCTVSKIVKRFAITGQMPLNARQPTYGDFSGATDLHTAMNLVLSAQNDFDALDPYVREAADNDPELFAEMLCTDEGISKLKAAGLTISEEDISSPPEGIGEEKSAPTPAPEPEPPSQ